MSYKDSHKGEKFAKEYDKNISCSFEKRIYDIENKILLDFLYKYSNKGKKSKILDFACGTGRITGLLYQGGYHNIEGIDVSSDMLSIASKKTPNIQFLQKDILANPIVDKYDLITSFRFFLNAEEDLKINILKGLHNGFDSETKIIFNIHMNTFSITFLLTYIKYILGFSNVKQNHMSYWKVKKMLNMTGYKLIETKGYSFFLGNPLLVYFPFSILYRLDIILSKVKILRYFSKDLMFVAIKDEK